MTETAATRDLSSPKFRTSECVTVASGLESSASELGVKTHTRMRQPTTVNERADIGPSSAHRNHRRQQASTYTLKTVTSYPYLLVPILLVTSFVPTSAALQLPPTAKHDPLLYEAKCLACIKSVTSAGVELARRCEGYYCGPYQFSYQYWAEAGKPAKSDGVRDFEKCARDTDCAESTVKAYFKKFKRDCNQDGLIDCQDMAALHKVGPTSCSADWFYKSRYWKAFNMTSCVLDREFATLKVPTQVEHKNQAVVNKSTSTPQIVMKNQTLTSECLDCICEALTSCGGSSHTPASSSSCGSGTICGPFAISQSYWKDGRRPGASWTACARTKECSIVTIKNYMEKYKRDCNGDGFVTCEDYAAIHRRGPKSCVNRDLLKEQYWTRFLSCRANQKPKNDASMVKVSEDPSDQPTVLSSRWDSSSTQGDIPGSLPKQHAVLHASSPAAISPTVLAATTTTFTTSTPPRSHETTSTRLVKPTQIQDSHFEFSPYQPTRGNENDGQHHRHQPPQTSSLSPVVTYELNPVIAETRPTIAQASPQQATATTSSRFYEYSDSTMKNNENEPFRTQTAADNAYKQTTTSANTRTSVSATEPGDKTQTNIYHREHVHQPTALIVEDYNSLPTIIVGKPLGSISTSRISPPPPVVSLSTQFTHDGYPIDRNQYQSTLITHPTTLSMQQATATTSQTGSRFASPNAEPTTISGFSMITSEPKSSQSPATIAMSPDDPLAEGEDSVHEMGPSGFDRVVNNIVASPDFSKSYPPVPDHLVQQRKQPANLAPQRGPSHANKKEPTTTPDQAAGPKETTQRENSKTLSVMYQESDAPEQQSATSPSDRESSSATDSLSQLSNIFNPSSLRPDELNMTSLFEKGLNDTNRIPSECLDCICDASSNCDATVQCISKQREKNRCGLYMISWNQYKESDISLTPMMSLATAVSQKNDEHDEKLYYECSTDKNCAEKLIHLYIEKYSKDCNHDGKIDCYDIAALHRVGPDQCNSNKFLGSQYWRDFNHCYATDRLTTTIQPSTQSG